MPLTTDQPAASIERDIPCIGCSYNLRGLESTGHCPECGAVIVPSIRAFELRRADIPDPLEHADPRWLRTLAEGSTLEILTFALMLVLALARRFMYWGTPQRMLLVGVACTMWVTACYGYWKLATPAPGVRERHLSKLRLWYRTCAVAQLLLPCLAYRRQTPALVLLVVSTLITFAAAPTYYVLLAGLVRRMGRSGLHALTSIVAIVGALMSLAAFAPQLGGDGPDAISILMSVPTAAYGATDTLHSAIEYPLNGCQLVFVAAYLLTISTNVLVCVGLWRTLARAEQQATPQSP